MVFLHVVDHEDFYGCLPGAQTQSNLFLDPRKTWSFFHCCAIQELGCLRSRAQFEVKDANLGEGFLRKVRPAAELAN